MIPARELVVRSLGEALQRQPMSLAKLAFAWESAVGPAMARATEVALDADGTLRVTADTEHWRREVARSRVVIKQRLTDLLGRGIVKRLATQRKRAS